jgi:hypothetical protein
MERLPGKDKTPGPDSSGGITEDSEGQPCRRLPARLVGDGLLPTGGERHRPVGGRPPPPSAPDETVVGPTPPVPIRLPSSDRNPFPAAGKHQSVAASRAVRTAFQRSLAEAVPPRSRGGFLEASGAKETDRSGSRGAHNRNVGAGDPPGGKAHCQRFSRRTPRGLPHLDRRGPPLGGEEAGGESGVRCPQRLPGLGICAERADLLKNGGGILGAQGAPGKASPGDKGGARELPRPGRRPT